MSPEKLEHLVTAFNALTQISEDTVDQLIDQQIGVTITEEDAIDLRLWYEEEFKEFLERSLTHTPEEEYQELVNTIVNFLSGFSNEIAVNAIINYVKTSDITRAQLNKIKRVMK